MDFNSSSQPLYTELASVSHVTQLQSNQSTDFSPVIQRPMPFYQQSEQRTTQPVPVSTPHPQHLLPSSHQQLTSNFSPKCKLNCKCCAIFLMSGEQCPCNTYKITVATQTDHVQQNFDKSDYFEPKTSAYKLLQVCYK